MYQEDDAVSPDGLKIFLDWLERDSEAIVGQMFNAVVRATPSVVNTDSDRALLRSALTSHLPVLYQVVEAGETQPSVRLATPAKRWAQHLAVSGIDLPELVLAYDAAGDIIVQMFAHSLRHGQPRVADAERADALEVAMDRLYRYLRAAMTTAVALHLREAELLRRRTVSDLHDWIGRVLRDDVDEAAAQQRLNYSFAGRHVAFVLWSADPAGPDLDRAASYVRAATRARQLLQLRIDHRTIHGWLALEASSLTTDSLPSDMPRGVCVAFGAVHRGIVGFRISHREALEARRVATTFRPDRLPVVHFDDVAVISMASHADDLARSIVTRRVGPLLGQPNLVLTLRVWFAESGSPTRTARALGLHTNSVIKRLERIAEQLQIELDPGDLLLRVAIELTPLVDQSAALADSRSKRDQDTSTRPR
ncbi:CdaR family transcriptional regulator [uncultured Gordonia sp.]|uniref:PucR family transcriptional regulator n=1 Tax=uncultured Gordonia sp. TaxID=198437 RepID=UPI002588B4B3|nr:PucR family transcriptional regulator [uncultured Gordonia sp.]